VTFRYAKRGRQTTIGDSELKRRRSTVSTSRLVEIVAQFLLSIEKAPDDRIDPDFAVQLQEDVAYHLQSLDLASRDELATMLRTVAAGTANADDAAFIRELPDTLGIEGQ